MTFTHIKEKTRRLKRNQDINFRILFIPSVQLFMFLIKVHIQMVTQGKFVLICNDIAKRCTLQWKKEGVCSLIHIESALITVCLHFCARIINTAFTVYGPTQ